MATEAMKRAAAKYDKENTVGVYLKLNKKSDADVIAALGAIENKQGYIKALIREDVDLKKPKYVVQYFGKSKGVIVEQIEASNDAEAIEKAKEKLRDFPKDGWLSKKIFKEQLEEEEKALKEDFLIYGYNGTTIWRNYE